METEPKSSQSEAHPEAVRRRIVTALAEMVAAVEVVQRRAVKDLFEPDVFSVDGVDFVRLVAASSSVLAALPADLEDALIEARKRVNFK